MLMRIGTSVIYIYIQNNVEFVKKIFCFYKHKMVSEQLYLKDMDRLTPPKSLIVEGNLVEKWKRWKQDFTLYLTATEYTKKPNQVKFSLLLHCIGEKV